MMTAYGTYGQDTLRLGPLTLHINEIRAFAKDKGQYQSVFANGTFLKVGGVLYSGLNITNSIINKENVFLALLIFCGSKEHQAGWDGCAIEEIWCKANNGFKEI